MHLSTGFVGAPSCPTFSVKADTSTSLTHSCTRRAGPLSSIRSPTAPPRSGSAGTVGTEDKGFQGAGMNSFNHYAYGAVGAWLYATVAGINTIPIDPRTSTSSCDRDPEAG